MGKYYFFIILLGCLVIVLIILGFIVVGSPISQQDIMLDTIRISNFTQIKYDIETYYSNNHKLPLSLDKIKRNSSLLLTDPKTKQAYNYTVINKTSYKLCTEFSTDTKEQQKNSYNYYAAQKENQHKKGNDCITYVVAEYMQDVSIPTYTVVPSREALTPSSILCQSEEFVGILGIEYADKYNFMPDNGNQMTIEKMSSTTGLPLVLRSNPKTGDRVKVITHPSCQMEIDKL